MNKDRRKTLSAIHDDVRKLIDELSDTLENKPNEEAVRSFAERGDELKDRLENVKSEEEEARDNMPESSSNRETADAAVDEMDNALSSFDDFATALEEVKEPEIQDAIDALDTAAASIDNATA